MVQFYYKVSNKIVQSSDLKILNELGYEDVIWIDLNSPLGKEKRVVEAYLNTDLQTRAQAEEIESSSRYFESEEVVYGNTNFLISQGDGYIDEPLSYIIYAGILVTVRNSDLRTLSEISRRLLNNNKLYPTGFHLLISMLESRIDLDADMIEGIAKEITQFTRNIATKKVDSETLYDLSQLQENVMVVRENIIDKQRMLTAVIKSDLFPTDVYSKVNIMLADVNSLINHTNFAFERLEYLQDNIIGLINIEQNKIIKIFTVTSVVFMPPTLIASVYGMNFKNMPEIDWEIGYYLCLILILASMIGTILIFKKKKLL